MVGGGAGGVGGGAGGCANNSAGESTDTDGVDPTNGESTASAYIDIEGGGVHGGACGDPRDRASACDRSVPRVRGEMPSIACANAVSLESLAAAPRVIAARRKSIAPPPPFFPPRAGAGADDDAATAPLLLLAKAAAFVAWVTSTQVKLIWACSAENAV